MGVNEGDVDGDSEGLVDGVRVDFVGDMEGEKEEPSVVGPVMKRNLRGGMLQMQKKNTAHKHAFLTSCWCRCRHCGCCRRVCRRRLCG